MTRLGEHTRAVCGSVAPVVRQAPLALPVWRATTYAFDDADEFADVLAGARPGYSYARYANPTADAFAEAVAALEGVDVEGDVGGAACASGMAAISAVLFALTSAGGHVVAPREIYGGTYALLTGTLSRFGVETTFVDQTSLEAVRAALRPGRTRVVWAEALANPTMTVVDLPALAALASAAAARLVVDSTFASPVMCRPLEHGADLVVHSATKYLGGHSDATGGVVVGPRDDLAAVRATRIDLGGTLAPDEAFLLHRGLATLPLRVARQCETAARFAGAVAEHPRVVAVDHPALPDHRAHALARRLFDPGRYGAVVTLAPAGGRAAGMALAQGLRLIAQATSLGGVHTTASHVASTSHRQFSDEALHAAGIDPGAVRFSIGLEDLDDLVADVRAALDALPG